MRNRLRLLCAAALGGALLSGCSMTANATDTTATATTPAGHTHKRHAHKRAAHSGHALSVGVPAGDVRLITEPQAGISPVLRAIAAARHAVDLVMYENEDQQVDTALVAAEHRGVNVRVLLNGGYYGEGSSQNQPAYDYFKAHGVPVRWSPSYFALTHQKTLVADSRAYILTFNFTPQYYASSRDFGVIDTAHADVAAIERTFNADWSGEHIESQNGEDLVWSPGSQDQQVALIDSARGSLDIYNEEMDSTEIESALAAAARRGVNVRVTMTYSPEWKQAFNQLAAEGVHIRTYTESAPLYIHAKLILSGERAFVGSQNFSYTSLNRNRELGLIITAKRVLRSLRATFSTDYANARPYSG